MRLTSFFGVNVFWGMQALTLTVTVLELVKEIVALGLAGFGLNEAIWGKQ